MSDKIPGSFHIEYGGEKHAFHLVNDVSISGMGIYLDNKIPDQTEVIVSYVSEDFQVAISGSIIWSEQLTDNSFRMGVQFSSDNMDDNVMLFMTLREYIDDFGEAF